MVKKMLTYNRNLHNNSDLFHIYIGEFEIPE